MNQTSIISLLTNMNQTAGLLGGMQASGKSQAGVVGVNAGQSFQVALKGFLSGQTSQANNTSLPTTKDGKLDLNTIKGMSQAELSTMLEAQGITPEMLLGVASQLLVSGQLNGINPEQLQAVQELRNSLAAGMDPEAAMAIETNAKNSVSSILQIGQSADGKTVVNPSSSLTLSDEAVKTTVDTLTQIAKVLGVTKAAPKAAPISAALIAANEASLANGVDLSHVGQLTKGMSPSQIMANAPSDAGEFKPHDPQNIATTVLTAGNASQAQAQTTNANATQVVADTKAGEVSALAGSQNQSNSNTNSNGNGNGANGNGSQQSSNANPLLAQIMQDGGKANPLNLLQQNASVPAPSLQAQGAEIALATAAKGIQPQTTQVVSIFDGAMAVEAAANTNTAQTVQTAPNGQTLANGLASAEAPVNPVAKEHAVMTRAVSTLPQAVTQNVGMQISKAVQNGQTDFTIRIDPPELGRVNVKISFGNEGSMRAMVTVDTREALNLLQRDAHVLERALGDLGSKLDQNSLNFSLKDQSNEGAQDGLSAKKESGNGAEFDAALIDGEDVMNDILPFIDASRTLDIRI